MSWGGHAHLSRVSHSRVSIKRAAHTQWPFDHLVGIDLSGFHVFVNVCVHIVGRSLVSSPA